MADRRLDGQTPLTVWQWAIRESRLSPLARHVALTMALRMDTVTLETTVGVDTIARESGWSERSVQKALRELRLNGYLFRRFRGSGFEQTSNLWLGRLPDWHRASSSRRDEPAF